MAYKVLDTKLTYDEAAGHVTFVYRVLDMARPFDEPVFHIETVAVADLPDHDMEAFLDDATGAVAFDH